MISATEARQMINKEVAINECKRRTEAAIMRAVENGRDKTCLEETGCYLKEDGTVGTCSRDGRYIDCKHEIKAWLKDLGYRIEPTGYIGGVLQRTEDICW